MTKPRKRVFISYSSKDREKVQQIVRELRSKDGPDVNVWFDVVVLEPGAHIALAIEAGIRSSDYYVLVVSENSKESAWVRQEISLAFSLSAERKIAPVPFLISHADIPFEFKGLKFIDGRVDLRNAIKQLKEFLIAQVTKIKVLAPRILIQKDAAGGDLADCQDRLRELDPCDLRLEMTKRMTVDQIAALWHDMFMRLIHDEVPRITMETAPLALIDRCYREDKLDRLMVRICKNYPGFYLTVKP